MMTDEEIKEQLKEIMDHQDARDRKVDAMAQDVSEIKGALLDSTYYKNGIISRIERLEAQARKEMIFRIKIVAMWAGGASAVSFICWLFFYLIPHLMK